MTTAAASLYGRMGRPDGRRQTQINAGIEELLEAAFTIWGQTDDKTRVAPGRNNRFDAPDRFYYEALALLEPHRRQLQNINPEQLHSFMSDAANKHVNHGLFSSALINVSRIARVNAPENANLAGYRLQKGKMLVIGQLARGRAVGALSEGTIVNFSDHITSLAESASGASVNYGRIESFARNATRGVHINATDDITNYIEFASGVQGGVSVNIGKVSSFAQYATGGVQANLWKSAGVGHPTATGGVQADTEHAFDTRARDLRTGRWTINQHFFSWADAERHFGKGTPELRQFRSLQTRLNRCVSDVEWVKRAYSGYVTEDVLKKIAAHDWAGMEKQATEIGKQLEAMVK